MQVIIKIWRRVQRTRSALEYYPENEMEQMYNSDPQPFWHQGLISWKTIFPHMTGGGMIWG